jgi:lactoylglutathione lyase
MMTLERIDHVYYWVSDMGRSVEFYRDVLGLRLVRQDGPSWAEFDAGAVRLALHGAIDGHPVEPGGATAVFEVPDLDAARALLEERGAELLEEVGEVEGFARFATVVDPDGNRIQLIEYAKEGS